jgi:hypothetical protein
MAFIASDYKENQPFRASFSIMEIEARTGAFRREATLIGGSE